MDGVEASVSFTYVLQLVNPRQSGGVFGVFDPTGELNKSGLRVSN